MPSGEKHSSKVVDVLGGVVNKIYSFTSELPAMVYVRQIYLSTEPCLKTLEELKSVEVSSESKSLYAYTVDIYGTLSALL